MYALFGTQFYSIGGPGNGEDIASATSFYDDDDQPSTTDSVVCRPRKLDFISAFTLANIVFSFLAYFLLDAEDPENGGSKLTCAVRDFVGRFPYLYLKDQITHPTKGTADTANYDKNLRTSPKNTNSRARASLEISSSPIHRNESSAHAGRSLKPQDSGSNTISGTPSVPSRQLEQEKMHESNISPIHQGRRFPLLAVLAAGGMAVFLAAMMFRLHGSGRTMFIVITFNNLYAPVSKLAAVA